MTLSPREPNQPSPAVPMRGKVESVRGKGISSALPEASEARIRLEDGALLEFGIPAAEGQRVEMQIFRPPVAFTDFGVCPICMTEPADTDDHVPPQSIGGHRLVRVCSRCNSEFGSRYEAEFAAWYQGAMRRVRLSGGDVPGRRKVGDYYVRLTTSGEPVLLSSGALDSALTEILASGNIELSYEPLRMWAVKLAAAKSAYLAACVMFGRIPTSPRADALRAEFMAALDVPRRTVPVLGPIVDATVLSRTRAEPVRGAVSILVGESEGGAIEAVGFNDYLAVTWPLDPLGPPPDHLGS